MLSGIWGEWVAWAAWEDSRIFSKICSDSKAKPKGDKMPPIRLSPRFSSSSTKPSMEPRRLLKLIENAHAVHVKGQNQSQAPNHKNAVLAREVGS